MGPIRGEHRGRAALEGRLPLRGFSIERSSLPAGAFDRLFPLSIAVGTAATLLVVVLGIHGHAVLPTADLVLDTVALIVSGILTALAYARFRERQAIAAIYQAAAFLVLTVAYGLALIVSLQHGTSIGSLAEPEDAQTLVFAVANLAAATLFVVSGVFTARRTYGWLPSWILLAPALAVLLAALIARLVPPPDALRIITLPDASGLPTSTPFGAVVHLATASLFFGGAFVSRSLWRANRAVIDGWIALGLVFAGFAELHRVIYPSAHPGQVSTADLLLLASCLTLLLGLESAVRSGLRELRDANAELEELRDAEVERAALEERARLARELHDGLAQDLWLAKLRTGELASMGELSEGARRVAAEAAAAIDVGLGDAREAVATLRSSAHDDSGFCNLVRRTVEDYGDRFGLRVEFAFEGPHTTRIAPRTQAEVLRIIQEALTNVARHADASVVGVRLAIRGDRITVRIVDNGRGFDAAEVGPHSFGLASMRERADLIGGRLRVASREGAGTRIVLAAPFAPAAALADVERG